ncbi:hypothetical protein D3I60_01700 [Brevibacterium permense]|uniref:hypothetical protein n=1 Tax=Brevibacterium permense TaxID=234834 RepID=UPI0021D22D02|nr:hypothetical protein [Brevibacterium permense]MCU4295806.1 hypothetical protein [Brevibacterium permense]
MGSEQTDVALSLARIEGKLDATLPELASKSNRLSDELTVVHGRVTDQGRTLAGHTERIEDLEERVSGQLGRTAQIVAVAGGVLGLLALIVPTFLPAL